MKRAGGVDRVVRIIACVGIVLYVVWSGSVDPTCEMCEGGKGRIRRADDEVQVGGQ